MQEKYTELGEEVNVVMINIEGEDIDRTAGEFAKDPSYMQPRSLLITCYALCGFANFSSIAIQIGGISGIAPERRSDLARLGLRGVRRVVGPRDDRSQGRSAA